jgi:hypothetical protein
VRIRRGGLNSAWWRQTFILCLLRESQHQFSLPNRNFIRTGWMTYLSLTNVLYLQYRLIPGLAGCFGLAVKKKGAIGANDGYDPGRL